VSRTPKRETKREPVLRSTFLRRRGGGKKKKQKGPDHDPSQPEKKKVPEKTNCLIFPAATRREGRKEKSGVSDGKRHLHEKGREKGALNRPLAAGGGGKGRKKGKENFLLFKGRKRRFSPQNLDFCKEKFAMLLSFSKNTNGEGEEKKREKKGDCVPNSSFCGEKRKKREEKRLAFHRFLKKKGKARKSPGRSAPPLRFQPVERGGERFAQHLHRHPSQ